MTTTTHGFRGVRLDTDQQETVSPIGRFFGGSAAVCHQVEAEPEQQARPQTPDELHEYMRDVWGLSIPDKQVCPDHVSPFRAFCAAYFAEAPIIIWLASRGFGGKSALLAALGLAEAATLGAGVTILGGSGEQSRRVHAYMEGTDSNLETSYWNAVNAPRHLLAGNVITWRTRLRNSGWIHALTASQRSVRGPHPQRMRLDECFVADTRIQTPCGPKAIQNVQPGDVVHTYDGGVLTEAVVRRAASTGRKPVVCVQLNDRTRLHVTRNHPFWTPHGWRRADTLEGSGVYRVWTATVPAQQRAWPMCKMQSRDERPSCASLFRGDRGQARSHASLVSVDSIHQAGWAEVYNLSVAGPHTYLADGVLVHNCDEMDLKLFDASMGQPMAHVGRGIPSQVVGSSTHHHADGTMTEILKRARTKDWPVYSWCYRESMAGDWGWLTQDEVSEKQRVVTAAMWKTEYELQEPSIEGRAFDTDAVEQMFDPEHGECGGAAGEIQVWERPTWELDPDWPALPAWTSRYVDNLEDMGKLRSSRRWRKAQLATAEQGEWERYREQAKKVRKRIKSRYAAGADWGKERDHTIIWIMRIDCQPMRMVAYANLVRQPYPKMFAQFNDFVARFGAQSAHDATGIGKAAEDYMETSVIDLAMVGQARRELFNEYIVAVEAADVVAPRVTYAYDEHRFCTQDDLWGTGHPPDSVVAGAMTVHAATYGRDLVR